MPRKRALIACQHCRRRKIRCSGYQSDPGGKCRSCARMNLNAFFSRFLPRARQHLSRSLKWSGVPHLALSCLEHMVHPWYQAPSQLRLNNPPAILTTRTRMPSLQSTTTHLFNPRWSRSLPTETQGLMAEAKLPGAVGPWRNRRAIDRLHHEVYWSRIHEGGLPPHFRIVVALVGLDARHT